MPQFDLVTFFNQVFWFFFGFFCFYFVTVYFFLPFLCENLKYRKKKMENNIFLLKETSSEYFTQYAWVNSVFEKNGSFLNKAFLNTLEVCAGISIPLIRQKLYSFFVFKKNLMSFLIPVVTLKKTNK